jgi:hypothetical protein
MSSFSFFSPVALSDPENPRRSAQSRSHPSAVSALSTENARASR